MKKLISIITPTYNEEDNIEKLCSQISQELLNIDCDYEHIVMRIDIKAIYNCVYNIFATKLWIVKKQT